MFVALYEIVAKVGQELEFESAWSDVTDAIYRVRGSYGSRLHKAEAPRTYVAYAQWPSEEAFDRKVPDSAFTDLERLAFTRMKEAAESVKLLHRLGVHIDLWKPAKPNA